MWNDGKESCFSGVVPQIPWHNVGWYAEHAFALCGQGVRFHYKRIPFRTNLGGDFCICGVVQWNKIHLHVVTDESKLLHLKWERWILHKRLACAGKFDLLPPASKRFEMVEGVLETATFGEFHTDRSRMEYLKGWKVWRRSLRMVIHNFSTWGRRVTVAT